MLGTHAEERRVACSIREAHEACTLALARVGRVVEDDPPHRLRGRIPRWKIQVIRVRISLQEQASSSTQVLIEALADDLWGAGARYGVRVVLREMEDLPWVP